MSESKSPNKSSTEYDYLIRAPETTEDFVVEDDIILLSETRPKGRPSFYVAVNQLSHGNYFLKGSPVTILGVRVAFGLSRDQKVRVA